MTVKEGPRQPERAEYPIPPWQAQARSAEPVKDSDNGATARAAQSVLDWLGSGGQPFALIAGEQLLSLFA